MGFKNSRRQRKEMTICGGLLLAVLLIVLCFLVFKLVPWHILSIILCVIAALIVVFVLIGAFLPFNIDKIISDNIGRALDPFDRRLLDISLRDSIDQDELDSFLDEWDIEKAPIKSVILVSYLMKTHPEVTFPQAIIPRLNGVLSFCRFQNLKREAHLCRIGKLLASEDIPFVVLKGGAMKVYRPDFPRWMNDIDIIVPSDRYERTLEIAVSNGYSKAMLTDHSVDLSLPGSEEGLLDIHHHLELMTGKDEAFNEGLFSRAKQTTVFSVQGFLPCPEDMVFIALVNLFKNLVKRQAPESCLTTFYHLKFLVDSKKDFDWDLISENARLTDSEFQVYYSTLFISQVLPDLMPGSFKSMEGIRREKLVRQATDYLFHRDILASARDEVMDTGVGKSLKKDWNVFIFMWVAFVDVVKWMSGMQWIKRMLLKYKSAFKKG